MGFFVSKQEWLLYNDFKNSYTDVKIKKELDCVRNSIYLYRTKLE